MRITGKTRKALLIQNTIYYLLLFIATAAAGWLSVRYSTQIDWSANNRNSLSSVSREVVETIDDTVYITAFVTDDQMMRSAIRDLVGRFQRYKKNITLEFVNPQTNPARTREMNVTHSGEIVIRYKNVQERLQTFNEQSFTNALQKLARGEERWVVFLTGHGELDPYAQPASGLSNFTNRVTAQGFSVQSLNLLVTPKIPDNTNTLVIASPQKDYLPGEIEIVLEYIRKGGNLLWLTEPGSFSNLEPIATELGIERLPGVIVDATGQIYGITQPDFVFVVNYPDDEIMRDINEFTLFPQAVGLTTDSDNKLGLNHVTFLQTLARSWTELGAIEGDIAFDIESDEIAGPIDIGIGLSRSIRQEHMETNSRDQKTTQRIAVVGDGDFMTNAYIGYGSNMLLGINLMNWLSHDDNLISVDAVSAPDTQLNISSGYVIFISLFFLILLPLAFITIGTLIWLRRRKK